MSLQTIKGLREYFGGREKQVQGALSLLIAVFLLLFFSMEIPLFSFLDFGIPKHIFVLLFLALFVFTLGVVVFFTDVHTKAGLWKAYEKVLLLLLPGALVLILCLTLAKAEPMLFKLGAGLYVIFAGFFLLHRYIQSQKLSEERLSARAWLREQGQMALFLVLLSTSIFFLAGLHRLTEFAAVDEPLWLEGRIAKYWNNIGDREWRKTSISDKPGITIALATGPGLLYKNFREFDTLRYRVEPEGRQSALERFYMAFRFPLLAVITLLLPFFYFFLERLTGRVAAVASYGLIATSPILVGMSKIINPDALLWLLVPLSLLAYLVFLKKGGYRYLLMAGVFFGLALLTKYVANILLIFLFGLLFVDYLYRFQDEKKKGDPLAFSAYLKKSVTDLFFYLFVALTVFYLLFPAVWIAPFKLLESTLLSQAFEKVATLFLIMLILVFCDQYFNRARLITAILTTLERFTLSLARVLAGIFLGGIVFVFANVTSGMAWVDFMDLLESPKNIATQSDFLAGYLTNFYPLVFGLIPVALLGLILGTIFLFRPRFWTEEKWRLSFYLVLFILLYYFGGTINGVASIVRYQIILFPFAAIIAGIALAEGIALLQSRLRNSLPPILLTALLVVGAGTWTLATTPLPLSYASSLLPGKYYTDLKDMGPGYEIAQTLNALPDAKNLVIWTDKDGVCKFFLGVCRRGFSANNLRLDDYDYIVVSSTRESRTSGMMRNHITAHPNYVPLHTYYQRTDPAYTVLINGRPSHFVKAFAYPKQ